MDPVGSGATRHRITRMLVGLGVCLLGAGCTPTTHRLQPYRDDPVQAHELERRASEFCCRRRGPTDLPPHHFTTDGCSDWPDGSWASCRVDHDIAYWCGGSCADRAQADDGLRRCVADSSSAAMGAIMYLGVRLGGLPWYPTASRWAYGWDWPHGYDRLPEEPIGCPAGAAASFGGDVDLEPGRSTIQQNHATELPVKTGAQLRKE